MNIFSPVFTAIVLATLLSAITTYRTVKMIGQSAWLLGSDKTPAKGVAPKLALILALIAFPFAWFLGFVIGGNFGGAIASVLPEIGISEKTLIPFGIGLGIFICATFLSIAVALIGFVIGRYFEQ